MTNVYLAFRLDQQTAVGTVFHDYKRRAGHRCLHSCHLAVLLTA